MCFLGRLVGPAKSCIFGDRTNENENDDDDDDGDDDDDDEDEGEDKDKDNCSFCGQFLAFGCWHFCLEELRWGSCATCPDTGWIG